MLLVCRRWSLGKLLLCSFRNSRVMIRGTHKHITNCYGPINPGCWWSDRLLPLTLSHNAMTRASSSQLRQLHISSPAGPLSRPRLLFCHHPPRRDKAFDTCTFLDVTRGGGPSIGGGKRKHRVLSFSAGGSSTLEAVI